MSNPHFSVVVSCYNYGRFLKECVDSVLAQDYPRLEIIVVDDGSKDNTRQVMDSFGSAIMPVFKPNGGQISAWNAGLSKAVGDLVILLDADDLLAPGVLREYAAVFEQSGVVRCQGYLRIVTTTSETTDRRIPAIRPDDGDLKAMVLSFGPASYVSTPTSGNAWSAAFTKGIIPLPESAGVNADALFHDAAPLFGITVTLDQEVGSYRMHGDSISDHKSVLNARNMRQVLHMYDSRCAWIKTLAARLGLVADAAIWEQKNWRIATVRYLLHRLDRISPAPAFWDHLKTVCGTRSWQTRIPLALLLLAIRLAPTRQALWLAKRKINLQYM